MKRVSHTCPSAHVCLGYFLGVYCLPFSIADQCVDPISNRPKTIDRSTKRGGGSLAPPKPACLPVCPSRARAPEPKSEPLHERERNGCGRRRIDRAMVEGGVTRRRRRAHTHDTPHHRNRPTHTCVWLECGVWFGRLDGWMGGGVLVSEQIWRGEWDDDEDEKREAASIVSSYPSQTDTCAAPLRAGASSPPLASESTDPSDRLMTIDHCIRFG